MQSQPSQSVDRRLVYPSSVTVQNEKVSFPIPLQFDGYLVKYMGKIMAAYYHGIELYAVSAADGEIDGRKVQIKISQQDKSDCNVSE